MNEIILASLSPRRKELMNSVGFKFSVKSCDIEEKLVKGLKAEKQVMRLATKKAVAVASENRDDIVIGADTVVVFRGKILGKPKDKDDAYKMLCMLNGKSHYVYTGVSIVHGDIVTSFYEKTKVCFYKMSEEFIDKYTDTDEPYDKAGAYAIQGGAGVFVKKITGDYNNVVGLPVSRLYQVLSTEFDVQI